MKSKSVNFVPEAGTPVVRSVVDPQSCGKLLRPYRMQNSANSRAPSNSSGSEEVVVRRLASKKDPEGTVASRVRLQPTPPRLPNRLSFPRLGGRQRDRGPFSPLSGFEVGAGV